MGKQTENHMEGDEFQRRLLEDDPADWPGDWDRISSESSGPSPLVDARIREAIRQQTSARSTSARSTPAGSGAASGQSPHFRLYAAVAMIAMMPAFVWLVLRGMEEPSRIDLMVRAVQGDARAHVATKAGPGPAENEGALVEVTPGTAFDQGSEFRLGPRSFMYLTSAGMLYRLRGPARMSILGPEDAPGPGVWFYLKSGSLALISESPRAIHPGIKTDRALYRVTGTMGRLTVQKGADVLEVSEGRIAVETRTNGDPITLSGGERLSVDETQMVSKRRLNSQESRALAGVQKSLRMRRDPAIPEPGAGGPDGTGPEGDRSIDPGPAGPRTLEELRVLHGTIHQLTLKDGRRLEGHILTAGKNLVIVTTAGRITVPQHQLLSIEAR